MKTIINTDESPKNVRMQFIDIYFNLYDKLPMKESEKAKKNYLLQHDVPLIVIPTTPLEAINWGFTWSRTPQKQSYWESVADRLRENKRSI